MNLKTNPNSKLTFLAKFIIYSQIILTPLIFSPISFYTFTAPKLAFLRITTSLLSLLILIKISRPNSPDFTHHEIFRNLPLTLFLLSILISTVFSTNHLFSIFGIPGNSIGFTSIISLVIFFIAIRLFFTREDLPSIFTAIAFTGTIASIFSILQANNIFFNLKFTDQPLNRLFFPLGQAIHLGAFLLFTIPATKYHLVKIPTELPYQDQFKFSLKNLNLKLIPIFALILQLYTLFFTGSRSAVIALFLTSILIFPYLLVSVNFLKKQFFKKLILRLIIFLLTILLILPFIWHQIQNNPLISRSIEQIQNPMSSGRASWLESGLKIFFDYPLFGSGISTFQSQYSLYRTPSSLLYTEANPSLIIPESSHSKPIDLLANQGIFGFISFYFFIFWLLKKLLLNQPHNSDQLIRRSIIAFQLISFALIQQLFSFETIPLSLYFWLTIALFYLEFSNPIQENKTIFFPILKTISSLILLIFFAFNLILAYQQFFSDQERFLANSTQSKNFINHLNKAISFFPYDYEYYQNLATKLYLTYPTSPEFLQQSLQNWKIATILAPNFPLLHYNSGLICFRLFQLKKISSESCIPYFTTAIQKAPNNPLIPKLSSKYLTELNRPDLAIIALKKTLSLTPEDSDAKNALNILIKNSTKANQ